MPVNTDNSKANFALDQKVGASDDAQAASLGGFVFKGGGGSIAKAMDAATIDQESKTTPWLVGGAIVAGVVVIGLIITRR